MSTLPETQYAVQLTGPDTLELNTAKPVTQPGPYQLLCKTEAVGLCFSDLKLLKQFSGHVRKSEIIAGADPEALKTLPSYVPGEKPTVPGHEVVVTVVAVGPNTEHKVGDKALVQADYRWLKTASSNGAFGYNLEGGLQEYVLMDERLIKSPEGEFMLIPASEEKSCSSIALVEPWACVEDAYVNPERQTAKGGGKMLVVAEEGRTPKGVTESFSPEGKPAEIVCAVPKGACTGGDCKCVKSLDDLGDARFDDIIYFGAKAETINRLDQMLAFGGYLNLVLGGEKIGQPVEIGVGRIHYGLNRIIGTTGDDASEGYKNVPATPEIRKGDVVLVTGAGGPMGVMHVVRNLCQGVADVEVIATDFDDPRLAALDKLAEKAAKEKGLKYRSLNPSKTPETIEPDYAAIMVPVPALVAQSVKDCKAKGIINIFAGIPATVSHEIDLDAYVEKQLYFVGTSGSNLEDMRIVLKKVTEGSLDTDVSVAAVSGMAGAIEGIRAVEDRSVPGKIMVYPKLKKMGMISLEELEKEYPEVFSKLDSGKWTKEAEEALLAVAE